MIYPDVDYINDMYYLIMDLSHRIRKTKSFSESELQNMISLTIDLLTMLELYLNDKYDY